MATLDPSPLALLAVAQGTPRNLSTERVQITRAQRLRPAQAARDGSMVAPVTVQADDVVRVEYDNGLWQWMRADELLRSRGRQAATRGDGQPAAWDIDTAPRFGAYRSDVAPGTERGVLGLGIKVLEFFGVEVTAAAAGAIGRTFERRQLGREPGLYRVSLAPQPTLVEVASDDPHPVPAGRPVLLFLHGTMSSFAGSYAALGDTAEGEAQRALQALRAQIAQQYGQEVFSYEHRTLSQSPIHNALDLVRQLPAGARLHLVSHSRGGLVGELLTLGQRDKRDDPLRADQLDMLFAADRTVAVQLGLGALDGEAARARDQAYADDRLALAELVKLLDEHDIQVSRFVRVACPARGTTLASGRLDRWLSVLDVLTPDNLFGDVADFLLAVVKQRTDPRTLPGVEAMMPGSALTQLLRLPTLRTSADLSVIAGDIEGKSLWGQLKLLALDWFYEADHDLVVNTGSMMGGIARPPAGARFRLDRGAQVTHFNYFRNRASIEWLAAGLGRADGSDGGYAPIAEAPATEPAWRAAVRASRAASTPRPIAIVVPGTMGSALQVKGSNVWLAYWPLLKGGLGDIGIQASGVEPVDLLADFYGPLLVHLARTHQVEIVPYDWRLSVRLAARRLTDKLEIALDQAEKTQQPVHIVAHSMGGLVARAMIADGGAGERAWRRLTALPNSRLLMLGTPNRGSYEAVRWLTGFNPTQAKLILLDLTRGANGVIDIVRRYPGLAELLPWDRQPNPWADAATWTQLRKDSNGGWMPIEPDVLRQASQTWDLLRSTAVDAAHMRYVAGCQPATVVDHRIEDDFLGFGQRKLRWIATADGDGTVPWASGRLPEVPMYYAPDTGHDQLCSNTDDARIFRGYVDLLLTGKTDQLATTPPGRDRAAAPSEPFLLPDMPVLDDLPDEAAVRGLGFGGTRARPHGAAARAPVSVLQVGMRHGNLHYAPYPVLVGHYQGDTIVSAEAALDSQMRGDEAKGPLSRRRDLGLYPGPLGTHAVFFNELPDRQPAGAVVVGLGQVGELTPSRLEASVRDALLEYALRLLQRKSIDPKQQKDPARLNARVSSLLVGSGAASLTVRESIEATLRGALAANRRLEEARLDQKVLVDRVEFIELYEDLAIGAAQALADLVRRAEFGAWLAWPGLTVETGEGGHQRSHYDADASWWQRWEITENRKAEQLRFVVTGDQARAEESINQGQLDLADRFIAQACGSARSDDQVSKTLYEMLLPNRLKQGALDQRATVLLLDEASARFPWELLEDRWSPQGRPRATCVGIVRQLKASEFRQQALHAEGNNVYVVGNPLLNWPVFPDLPGARHEATRVCDIFGRGGYDVSASIGEHAQQVLSGLHEKPWKVLHLAGHGDHEFEVTQQPGPNPTIQLGNGGTAIVQPRIKKRSGMVIGRETFLTPGDVQQVRHVPELVFINCCKLGTTGGGESRHNKLAANLGVEFIRMGVRAVVCAGWVVDDGAALVFAEQFYGAMLQGVPFGQAVLQARQATWRQRPDVNTWGAYQCYGDPDYRLVNRASPVAVNQAPDFRAPSELVVQLRNLAESTRMKSRTAHGDEAALQDELRQRIAGLLARIPAPARQPGKGRWEARADVCAALGFAYGEGRLFQDAVDWLNKALGSGVGDCPVRAAEQCANFAVRLAAQDWVRLRTQQPADGDEHALSRQRGVIAQCIQQALAELDIINQRASTSERLNLLGSACKRLAWVQTGSARLEALINMTEYYRLACGGPPPCDNYAFTNWALARLLLGRLDPARRDAAWEQSLPALLDGQAGTTRTASDEDPDFWKLTGLADLLLLELLLALDASEDACEALAGRAAAKYGDALARGSSPREAASLRENLDFLIDLAEQGTETGQPLWPAPVIKGLWTIRDAL